MAASKKTAKKVEERKFPLPVAHDYEVIVKPVVTEKSLRLMQEENKITVKVAPGSNSVEIKKAFEAIFNKKVERVNIVNVRTKAKRMGRFEGTVPAYKKAIIKLAPGEALDLFQEESK